jgi:hypothetical protein
MAQYDENGQAPDPWNAPGSYGHSIRNLPNLRYDQQGTPGGTAPAQGLQMGDWTPMANFLYANQGQLVDNKFKDPESFGSTVDDSSPVDDSAGPTDPKGVKRRAPGPGPNRSQNMADYVQGGG